MYDRTTRVEDVYVRSSGPVYRFESVIEAFTASAAAHADHVAIQLASRQVNYSQLNRQSNQLAWVLATHNVGPGTVVGISMPRSIEAITVCLAVLKAGAAYLPLDQDYPKAALEYMIEDAQPVLVISPRSNHYFLDGSISIEDLLSESERASSAPITATIRSDTPAYVMYTSGSTGRPKGVIVPHRGIIRLVCDTDFASFGPTDTLLEIGPLAFDYSVLEIYGMLLNGGRVAVLPDAVPSLTSIAEAITRERATCLCLTPAIFHLFVEHALEALAPLDRLFVAGDVACPLDMDKFRARFPTTKLHNALGHTENTTFTTNYTISPLPVGSGGTVPVSSTWGGGPVPVGSPIRGSTVYLLDDNGQPVSPGSVGTMWTGGDGVALGYLGLPELTAERFKPDPFSAKPGALMYCTGDLAYLRPDGAYAFVGRADRQVKIGGKRLELDAVEAGLKADVRVRDAAAVVRATAAGDKEIIAFIAPRSSETSDDITRAVAADFATRNPAFMLPACIVCLPHFPLSPTGKIDRARLLRDFEAREVASAARAPTGASTTSDLHSILKRIWEQALGRTVTDAHQSFFELGGSSLRMIEVHAQLKKQLKSDLCIADLFANPTLDQLANRIEGTTAPADVPSKARLTGDKQRMRLRQLRLGIADGGSGR